jgi:Ca2+-binding RTX toxin-like protein
MQLAAPAADLIVGNSADNILTGGVAIDLLLGGGGNDTFRDTAAGLNGDTTRDFRPGNRVVISAFSLPAASSSK